MVLDIVATDTSFARAQHRGNEVWLGKCLHCNRRLMVSLEGELLENATIEHIEPRTHGGSEDLENLALACARCNAQKGFRHDLKGASDPKRQEVVDTLRRKRGKRWRPPPSG